MSRVRGRFTELEEVTAVPSGGDAGLTGHLIGGVLVHSA